MAKMKYVKDFDFNEKACNYESGGPAMKMATGGAMQLTAVRNRTQQPTAVTQVTRPRQIGVSPRQIEAPQTSQPITDRQAPQTSKPIVGRPVPQTSQPMVGRPAMPPQMKKGGKVMQKEEMMKSKTEKNIGPRGGQGMIPPAQKGLGITAPRRQMPVAPREPMISPMKKGGRAMKAKVNC